MPTNRAFHIYLFSFVKKGNMHIVEHILYTLPLYRFSLFEKSQTNLETRKCVQSILVYHVFGSLGL